MPRRRHAGRDEARSTGRSLPDAREILEDLTRREVKLSIGGSVYDPTDPVGRLLFNVLAMVAEFESDLIRLRTREGMRVAKAKGRLRGRQPKLNPRQEAHLVALHRAGAQSTGELGDLFGVDGPPSTEPSNATAAAANWCRHPTPRPRRVARRLTSRAVPLTA